MQRQDFQNGGYELLADTGKDLVVLVDDVEVARTKKVIIPTEGTLNQWQEVDEKPAEVVQPVPTPTTEERIAQLEAELAELKAKQESSS